MFAYQAIVDGSRLEPRRAAPSAPHVRSLQGGTKTAKFDLTLLLETAPSGVCGTFEYASELFEPADIERLTRWYRQLLTTALAEPDQAIDRLPLLDARERAQVLAWSGHELRYRLTPILPGRRHAGRPRSPGLRTS